VPRWAHRLKADQQFLAQLRHLPWRVAWFLWRARRLAQRTGDEFSLVSYTRIDKLAEILRLAQHRRRVVELGTASGWTALALLVADAERAVISYDVVDRPERLRYLELVPASVRDRLTFIHAAGEAGPHEQRPVDLLYIDSSHERAPTVREFQAWRPVMAPRGVVVFDDYDHPDYPGIREAVESLGLTGEVHGTQFVHTLGGPATDASSSDR
jgi:predicted O-methyltransferase YrrM